MAQNRRTIWHALIFLGLGLCVGAILYAVGAAHYTQYDRGRARIEKLIQTKDADCLVLGNSHASIAEPGLLGCRKGVRLNHGGADLFEVAYQARYLAPRLPKLDTVFISMSYFTIFSDNGGFLNDLGTRTRREKRLRLYATYPSFQTIDGNLSDLVMGKLYPLFTQDHWKTILAPPTKGTARKHGPSAKKQLSRKQKIAGLDRHAHSRCRSVYIDIVPNMVRNHQGDIARNTKKALCSIVETFQHSGVKVVFFTPPYWPSYMQGTPPELIAVTKTAMKQLNEKYGVNYYDLSDDGYFKKHPELFVNSDHLDNGNQKAMKAFNNRLKRAMDQRRSMVRTR